MARQEPTESPEEQVRLGAQAMPRIVVIDVSSGPINNSEQQGAMSLDAVADTSDASGDGLPPG